MFLGIGQLGREGPRAARPSAGVAVEPEAWRRAGRTYMLKPL